MINEAKLLSSMAESENMRERPDRKEMVALSTGISSNFDDSSKAWNNPKLTVLDWYCPVGPCHVRLKLDELEGILKYLQNCFRKLSFYVDYQDSPISATCRSMDQVELKVSCFASQNKSNEEMVVEVAHIGGNTLTFHEYSLAIIRSISWHHNDDSLNSRDNSCHLAFGKQSPQMGPAATSNPSFGNSRRQQRPPVDTSQDLGSKNGKSAVEECFEIAYDFLSTERYDAQRRGVDMLIRMTDPNRSASSVVVPTAEALFFPNTETQEYVSHKILKWARKSDENDDENVPPDLSDLALLVFSQALRVAAKCKMTFELTTFWQTQVIGHDSNNSRSISGKNVDLLEFLMQEIHDMYRHPHRAYFAMESMVALLCCFPALRGQILLYNHYNKYYETHQHHCHLSFLSVVEAAQSFGDSHHLALATASKQLLLCLRQV